jgi:hypothetical protein
VSNSDHSAQVNDVAVRQQVRTAAYDANAQPCVARTYDRIQYQHYYQLLYKHEHSITNWRS